MSHLLLQPFKKNRKTVRSTGFDYIQEQTISNMKVKVKHTKCMFTKKNEDIFSLEN